MVHTVKLRSPDHFSAVGFVKTSEIKWSRNFLVRHKLALVTNLVTILQLNSGTLAKCWKLTVSVIIWSGYWLVRHLKFHCSIVHA